jgi:hypothetical protein
MGKFIYRVYKSPSSTILEYEVDSWQQAIDIWSNLKQSGNSPYISCIGESRSMIVNNQSGIREWSDHLLMKNYNRVERRVMLDMQEQEQNGMKMIETKDTGNYGYNDYLNERDAEALEVSKHNNAILDACSDLTCGCITDDCKMSNPDFHGEFSEMNKKAQDEIINPKHYKMIPKEAYVNKPNGLEYMDLMEYILDNHEGVEAHLLGQVFKYACRLGKKDNKLQDAKKIAWYANRLVEVIEYPREKDS